MSAQSTINAVTTAINSMVDKFISFDAACAVVRGHRASGLSDAEARDMIQAALLKKVAAYKLQVTPNGKPAQDSAFKKAVSRLMRYTSPTYAAGESAAQEAEAAAETKEGMEIPAAVLKAALALAVLCAKYEGSAKMASTAVAKARASLK